MRLGRPFDVGTPAEPATRSGRLLLHSALCSNSAILWKPTYPTCAHTPASRQCINMPAQTRLAGGRLTLAGGATQRRLLLAGQARGSIRLNPVHWRRARCVHVSALLDASFAESDRIRRCAPTGERVLKAGEDRSMSTSSFVVNAANAASMLRSGE